MILSSDIPQTLLTCQWLFVDEDGLDDDTLVDISPVEGTVKIVCDANRLKVVGRKTAIVPLTFEGRFNEVGQLIPKDGSPGIGMSLPAAGSEELLPNDFTYTISFDLLDSASGDRIVVEPFSFQLFENPDPEGTDLNDLAPISKSKGILTVQGPRGKEGPRGKRGLPGVDSVYTAFLVAFDGAWGPRPTVPDGAVVQWVGGSTKPPNAITGDLWVNGVTVA